MTVRLLFLQSHYSSELDITLKGLQDAEKGLRRLLNAAQYLDGLCLSGETNTTTDDELNQLADKCKEVMDDDFNTAKLIATLYEMASRINIFHNDNKKCPVSEPTFTRFRDIFKAFLFEVLGIVNENEATSTDTLDKVMNLVIDIRKTARENKDWPTSDKIRDALKDAKIILKDNKDGTSYEVE